MAIVDNDGRALSAGGSVLRRAWIDGVAAGRSDPGVGATVELARDPFLEDALRNNESVEEANGVNDPS